MDHSIRACAAVDRGWFRQVRPSVHPSHNVECALLDGASSLVRSLRNPKIDPGHARHVKNATVIAVCRRLVQAVTDRRGVMWWVKVKGHSGHEGNNAADDRATRAQNGGSKNESNISSVMAYLRQKG